MLSLPADLAFDPTIAESMQAPVTNGDLARSSIPVLIDVLQTAAHATLCPSMGVSGLLHTTERTIRMVVPAFARFARPVVIAAGDGDIEIEAVSGCSGSCMITLEGNSGDKEAYDAGAAVASADVLTLNVGDVDRAIEIEIKRSSTDVVCYALVLQIEGNTV